MRTARDDRDRGTRRGDARRPWIRGLVAVAVALVAVVALAATTDRLADASRSPGEGQAVAGHRPPTAQVEGAVVDREGAGVAGATVIVRPVGLPVALGVAARTFETLTDRHGRFHLDGLPPGTYWFVALHADHPAGSTPALPVAGTLEVSIRLDDEGASA